MRRRCRKPLAHPLFFGWSSVGPFMAFLVCNPIANVLIRNGLLESWFAEKPNRINAWLQTTNLGVRSSNLFGRATHSPSESITVKSLPLRVSGVAGWSVVTNTMPGFMRSSIAACTAAGGLMRSTTEVLGFDAPFLPVL